MKKKLSIIIALLFIILFACNERELVEFPLPDPYNLRVGGTSLSGELDLLLDGKVISTGTRVGTTQQLLYKQDEPRIIEVRQKGDTKALKTYTIDNHEKKDYNIQFYWNGEEISEELKLPKPNEGKIGLFMTFATPLSKREDPMDIEFLTGTYTNVKPEVLAKVEQYVPNSSEYTPFIQLDPTLLTKNEVIIKLLKSGTDEPYYGNAISNNVLDMNTLVKGEAIAYFRGVFQSFPEANTSVIVKATESQYGQLSEVNKNAYNLMKNKFNIEVDYMVTYNFNLIK